MSDRRILGQGNIVARHYAGNATSESIRVFDLCQMIEYGTRMKKWRGGSHGDPAVSNLPLCFGASDGASPRHSTNTPALRETARGTEPGVAMEALNSLRHAVAPLARRADHRRLPRPAVAQGPVPDGYVHVTLPQFPHQLVGQSHVLARLVFLRLPRQEPARTDPVGSVRSACAYRRARPG